MNKEIKAPEFEFLLFLPKHFFNKNVNEEFIKLVMKSILPDGQWNKGNVNRKEPDYIYNNIPFEFTLASNKCNCKLKDNFINKLRTTGFKSNNTEDDLINYIREQVSAKANKKYSLKNIHLCVLCLIDKVDWVLDEYGSSLYYLMENKREKFFQEIKNNYIRTKIFNNIFIIFPDIHLNWWVWDIDSDSKTSLTVTPQMVESKKYPYFIEKNLYVKLVKEGLFKDIFDLLK